MKPLKDELVVARNRFLAESMLNGGSKSPKIPKPKYSVPTCHTTLKQLEQARLAKEFELQRRKSLQNHINNNNVSEDQPKLKRTLSRATSVGKLVNNFEKGHFANNDDDNSSDHASHLEQAISDEVDDIYANSFYNVGGKPALAVKPPLATKPFLRHTVSVDCRNASEAYLWLMALTFTILTH